MTGKTFTDTETKKKKEKKKKEKEKKKNEQIPFSDWDCHTVNPAIYISQKYIKSFDFLSITSSLLKENDSKSECIFLIVFLKLVKLSGT